MTFDNFWMIFLLIKFRLISCYLGLIFGRLILSRKVANILEKLINFLVPCKASVDSVRSRLVEKLTNDDLAIIETSLGRLKVNKNRSPHVASAAVFFKDELRP